MKLETDHTVLITGASRGLGVEIARRFAEEGLNLILAARSEGALETVAEELRKSGARSVRTLRVDMADAASVGTLADQAGDIDVLINNAGVEETCAYDERSSAEIASTIAINLTGPMLLTRALLPGMIARGHGHVVNISSVAGLIPVPFNETYVATKFGLTGFTRALRMTAQAQGWPVSASTVCPGFVEGAGMFETFKTDFAIDPKGLDAVPLAEVGAAVIRAVKEDLADIIVASDEIRQIAAMSVLDPAAIEAGSAGSASNEMFRSVAKARRAEA